MIVAALVPDVDGVPETAPVVCVALTAAVAVASLELAPPGVGVAVGEPPGVGVRPGVLPAGPCSIDPHATGSPGIYTPCTVMP